MSETIPVTIKGAYPIDISNEHLNSFPEEVLRSFKFEVEALVEGILTEFGIKTADDVRNLPLNQWAELRNRLLAVNIKYSPLEGVTHE
jgi:hypothetical protein